MMQTVAATDRSTLLEEAPRAGSEPVVPARAGLFPLLLIAVIAFLLVFPWHAVNKRLPVWDGADFVLTAQKVATSMAEGPLEGARALYLERGWRPILFPSIAAPAFFLTGEKVRESVGLVQLFNVLIVAVYGYAFFRRFLSEARATLGTLLLVSLPWIVNFSNLFYSELWWLATTAGTLFHVTAALQTGRKRHYVGAGIWLGLMVASRPVETVLTGALPATILFVRTAPFGMRRALAAAAAYVAHLVPIGAAVVLLTGPEPNRVLVLGLFALSAAVVYWFRQQFFWVHPMLGLLLVGEVVGLVWHYPTIRALYLWAEATSVGSLAQMTADRFRGLSPITILMPLMVQYTPKSLAVIGVTAAAALIGLQWRSLGRRALPLAGAVVLMSLAMLLPMASAYSLTGAVDFRRIISSVFVLYVGLIGLALSTGGALPGLRVAVVAGLMLMQVAGAAANGLNLRVAPLGWVQSQLRNPSVGADPNEAALAGLTGLGLHPGNISAHTHCYRNWAQCEQAGYPAFEPMALSTLARERDVPLYVHYAGNLDFSKPETIAPMLKYQGFNYVLVDMLDSPAPVDSADFYAVGAEGFLALARREPLPPGFTSRGCFNSMRRPICVYELP